MILQAYFEKLPQEIQQFMSQLSSLGEVYLTGGAPRDFLLKQTISKDIDIEFIPTKRTLADFQSALDFIKTKYPTERLEFEILRVKINDFEVEISPPRKEIYSSVKSHKNFEPFFDFQMEIFERLKRRDFTINSLYFFLVNNEFHYRGPEQYLEDLRTKKLNHVSDDFIYDPVRIWRAFRFTVNLNFTISDELKQLLQKMDPYKASAYYRNYELDKCINPLLMIELLSVLYGWSWQKLHTNHIKNDELSFYLWIKNSLENLMLYQKITEKKINYPVLQENIIYKNDWKNVSFDEVKDKHEFVSFVHFFEQLVSFNHLDLHDLQEILLNYKMSGLAAEQLFKLMKLKLEIDFTSVQNHERKKFKVFKMIQYA